MAPKVSDSKTCHQGPPWVYRCPACQNTVMLEVKPVRAPWCCHCGRACTLTNPENWQLTLEPAEAVKA
jgi:hypothetical protein